MTQNEIIKYNIEKLGGLNTTLDSKSTLEIVVLTLVEMQNTLLKNELRNIEKNEANQKRGYSNNLANPDLKPP